MIFRNSKILDIVKNKNKIWVCDSNFFLNFIFETQWDRPIIKKNAAK